MEHIGFLLLPSEQTMPSTHKSTSRLSITVRLGYLLILPQLPAQDAPNLLLLALEYDAERLAGTQLLFQSSVLLLQTTSEHLSLQQQGMRPELAA